EGAPMPVPFCDGALEIGRERLRALRERARVPIGLENLALAFSRTDVESQGAFVDSLLADADSFVVLDLHNLWCQSVNFGIAAGDLLRSWPLSRVRELHLSGGRWSALRSDVKPFRRDTHDSAIPAEVLALLPIALASCPNAEVVIVERLGETLASREDEASFAEDVRRVREAV